MFTRKNAPPKKKFDRYWTIHVSFRVLTRFYYSHLKKNCPDPGCHVFFHEYWTKNVTFRVLTKFYTKVIKKAPPSGHVFQQARTILALIQDIILTIVSLTKFHEDWTINMTSKTYKCEQELPCPWWPCFQKPGTIFKLVHDNIRTHVLTTIHEDMTINVASIVLTR
ncbi:hypothetical protein DPMN_144398 [Dreissena polymorpha]|uniref:Uncharacterized protein n=1 Tax=Dreissena polymorpha TaxID=45954 RepID=A0A9D4GI41_DREPO|nr:hypothetical protein DPMN_144398 [Dreissena polymorpha]